MFRQGAQFIEWILNKLINAETACYMAENFAQRKRASLLKNLFEDLARKANNKREASVGKTVKFESSLKSVKKVMARRTKSLGLNAVPLAATGK